jgi:hypothetical protein
MREALGDPNLLGDVLIGDSWAVWRVMLISPRWASPDRQRARDLPALHRPRPQPLQRVDEAAFVVGRRGGKDPSRRDPGGLRGWLLRGTPGSCAVSAAW